MYWIEFFLGAGVIVIAAVKLAEYADAIAWHTKLGRLFVGTLLLAGATSLPEFLTVFSAVRLGHLNMVPGTLFGSNMFNMFLLGLLTLLFFRRRIFQRVSAGHALSAGLAVFLTGIPVFTLLSRTHFRIGWIGLESLAILVFYLGGVSMLRSQPGDRTLSPMTAGGESGKPVSLLHAAIGFLAVTLILIIVIPRLVSSATRIASVTGLGDGFVGVLLLAGVTSLPELVASLAAIRIGAFDMAIGNLFGSNMFNICLLALADLIHPKGALLAGVHVNFALAGMVALLISCLGLIGILFQGQKRDWIFHLHSLLIVLVYLGGVYLLYKRGLGG